jgi:protein-disulfide isomerase
MEVEMSTNRSNRELLRQKRKEQKRRSVITFILVSIAAIILILAAILLPSVLVKFGHGLNTPGFPLGNEDAPVTVVEFSSYNCSHCYDFNENALKDFISQYVDTGKVFFNYINIPSNNEASLIAASASYCAADQGKFYEYKDQLFAYSSANDGFSKENLINYAQTAGLNVDKFEKCLNSGKFADSYLQDVRYANSVNVTGTPTFLINGEKLVSSSELIPTVEEYLSN